MSPTKSASVNEPAQINSQVTNALNSPSTSEASPCKLHAGDDMGPTKSTGAPNVGASAELPTLLQPATMPEEEDIGLCGPSPQINRKLFATPTTKLLRAIQDRSNETGSIHVKLVRREEDEDTSSYESDSSRETVLVEPQMLPSSKKVKPPTNKTPKIDISAFLEQGLININQIPQKQPVDESDVTGIPAWFPVKIKRILKDTGFPDALPFKVRT